MAERYPFKLSDLNRALEEDGFIEPGEELEEEDFEELQVKTPKRPSFPVVILTLAVMKDLTDILSAGFLGSFTNIIAIIAIRIWLLGKMGFIKRYLYKRYLFAFILEFVPFVNAVPQWTIFVLRGHAKEYKRINQILTKVEELLIRHQKSEKTGK